MQGWLNIQTVINIIHHNNELKKKKMIISMDEEKSFDKIPFPITIKILSALEIEGTFFTLIKRICQNPLFNLYLMVKQRMFSS